MVISQIIILNLALGIIPGESLTERELPSLFFPKRNVLPQSESAVTLGAIVWKQDNIWSFWVNQQRVSPQAPHPLFKVVKVTPQHVEILWHASGETCVLKPGVSTPIPTPTVNQEGS